MNSLRFASRPSGSAEERSERTVGSDAGHPLSEDSRKPYLAPRLELCGKLSEIIQFGGSLNIDSGPGSLGDQP